VIDALDDRDLDYDSIWVEAMHSRRNSVKEVSGQRQVPVLVDDEYGVTMAESKRIIEFLENSYGEAGS
jgi:glutathione S-transferase